MTKKSLFVTVKRFSLRTDLNTEVVVEVSARTTGGRQSFRVGTFREWREHGRTHRSPWLGERELKLKVGLEESAAKFIAAEKAKQDTNVQAAA